MSVFSYALALSLFVLCSSEEYTSQYDGVDLDEILASDRLLNGYVKCLLDAGPCTPDAKELKNNLPDAVENDCKKCTKRQREGADKVMHYIIDHKPDDWEQLEKKYNADGSYKKKYLEMMEQGKEGEKEKENEEQKETNSVEEDSKKSEESKED